MQTKNYDNIPLIRVPVTIKHLSQLIDESMKKMSNSLVPVMNITISGKPAYEFLVLGRITEFRAGPQKLTFSVTDLTGKLHLCFPYEAVTGVPKVFDDLALIMSKTMDKPHAKYRKDLYVLIIVIPKLIGGKIEYMCSGASKVEDYNQITYFVLNCFATYAQRSFALPNQQQNQINAHHLDYNQQFSGNFLSDGRNPANHITQSPISGVQRSNVYAGNLIPNGRNPAYQGSFSPNIGIEQQQHYNKIPSRVLSYEKPLKVIDPMQLLKIMEKLPGNGLRMAAIIKGINQEIGEKNYDKSSIGAALRKLLEDSEITKDEDGLYWA